MSGHADGPVAAWISLGSNLGSRRDVMRRALEHVGSLDGTSVTAVSSLYETPPWGDTDQGAFLNAVARVDTTLAAADLLRALLAIEDALGRERVAERRWGPRCIDLDLLMFGDQRCATADLELPHPRMAERAFVLVPFAELDSGLELPGHGSVRDCLSRLDTGGIHRVAGPGWQTV